MHRSIALSLLALLSSASLGASPGPELTVSAGIRTGTMVYTTEANSPLVNCVTTPCVVADVLTEDDSVGLTLILDLPFSNHWMVEIVYAQQDGDHEFQSEFPDIVDEGTYDWDTAQVGLLRQWSRGKSRPFVAGTLGVGRFESSVPAYDLQLFPGILPTPVDEDFLSASLAAGIKFELLRQVDLRLEGRAWLYDLPGRLGGSLWQSQAGLGVTYRW